MTRRLYTPAPIRSAFSLSDFLIKLAIGTFGLVVGIGAALVVRGELIHAVDVFAAALPK